MKSRTPKVEMEDVPSPARSQPTLDMEDLKALTQLDAKQITMSDLKRVLEHYKVSRLSTLSKPQLVYLFEMVFQGRPLLPAVVAAKE
jgi:hypothetical protein